MSQPCAIKTCKRASRTLCHCCDQNLCRDHFNEHDDFLNSQLNPLADKINALGDRLAAFNYNELAGDCVQKLNQWRTDCYTLIDRLYDQKYRELDSYITDIVDKRRKDILDLRSKMSALIDKQETTKHDINSLTSAIHGVEHELNLTEQIRIQIDIHPLIIDNRIIQIGQMEEQQFDLLNLSIPYQTLEHTKNISHAIVSNDRLLLLQIDSNLCLIDENLSIVQKKQWLHGKIEDMCWSFTLKSFIVITEGYIFVMSENLMLIERVQAIQRKKWWTCGCSDKSLYLSRHEWDSSVFKFTLLPSIQFVKYWKTTDNNKQKQRVDSIIYNHGTLALAINDISVRRKLMELRSSKNFLLLWSIELDTHYTDCTIRCCLLNHNEWLVTEWCTSRLFHVTNDGKVKETCLYPTEPSCINLFSSNILAILTKERVNFHRV